MVCPCTNLFRKALLGPEDRRGGSDGILLDGSSALLSKIQVLENVPFLLVRPRYLLAVTCYMHAQYVLGFCTFSRLLFQVFEELKSCLLPLAQRNLSLIFISFESPVRTQCTPYSLCTLR